MTGRPAPQPYDFRKPSGLPNDIERRLLYWQRGAAALLPEKWRTHLALSFSLEHARQESLLMAEAGRQLLEATIGCRYELGENQVSSLFVVSRPVMLALVNDVLGDTAESLPDDRPLTAVELTLAEMLFEQLAEAISSAWPEKELMRCRIAGLDEKPHRTRMFALTDRVLVSRFLFQADLGQHEFLWLLPQPPLEELLRESIVEPASDQTSGTPEQMEPRARQIPVPLVVHLGAANLHVSELAELREGDLLVLDQKIDEPLEARVAGQTKFLAWPGRVGSRQAIRIHAKVDS